MFFILIPGFDFIVWQYNKNLGKRASKTVHIRRSDSMKGMRKWLNEGDAAREKEIILLHSHTAKMEKRATSEPKFSSPFHTKKPIKSFSTPWNQTSPSFHLPQLTNLKLKTLPLLSTTRHHPFHWLIVWHLNSIHYFSKKEIILDVIHLFCST